LTFFCDVAVPHTRLGELTYRFDGDAAAAPAAGDCVRVMLRGRSVKAVVLRRSEASAVARVLPVGEVVERGAVGPRFLELVSWVADYYRGTLGEALGAALPRGVCGYRSGGEDAAPLEAGRASATGGELAGGFKWDRFEVGCSARDTGRLELLTEFITRAGARGGVICLLPDVQLERLLPGLRAQFGGRVIEYRAGQTLARRKQLWRRMRSDGEAVVVGVRAAALAPIERVGGIAIADEHDPVFKEERHPRYHARDVAVKRAQKAGCPVLLSDPTPSAETWHNLAAGRYRWLHHPEPARRRRSVFVVDMRRQRDVLFSPRLAREMSAALTRGVVLLYLNRKGISRHVACRECGQVLSCPDCDVAMVLHGDGELSCPCCGRGRRAPERCPGCGGASFRFGAPGVEMVAREAGRIADARQVVVVPDDGWDPAGPAPGTVCVGTRALLSREWPASTALVAAVHFDYDLVVPDFRARERAFQTLAEMERRSRSLGARLVVQTWRPEEPAVECGVALDEARFMSSELRLREELGFPPYRRLAIVELRGRDARRVRSAAAEIMRQAGRVPGIEVLGPAEVTGRAASTWRLLVKSPRSRTAPGMSWLDPAAQRIPGVELRVDVDPLAVV